MPKAISDIKQEFSEASWEKRKELMKIYSTDSRKGVQNIIVQYRKKAKALLDELERLEEMQIFEQKYGERYALICGVDEAGRGPLAGPVVAGACVLPRDAKILYLNDSKKLSAKKRELLYDEICEKAVAWGVGIASPQRIDEINILQATYEAMQQAVASLKPEPELLLVDAVTIPAVTQKQVGIVKGDARSVSIAAASILAKVTRDRIMVEMDALYPDYGFAKNKGYGSAEHITALQEHGPCPIHRETFITHFI